MTFRSRIGTDDDQNVTLSVFCGRAGAIPCLSVEAALVRRLNPQDLTRKTSLALSAGLTAGRLRRPGYEHPSHGLVRPSNVAAEPLTLMISDVLALLTPKTCVGGWASLNLQGNHWFDGRDRAGKQRPALLHCRPGSQLRRRPALVEPFRGLIHPDETIDLGGFEVATMARAAYDEMRMAMGVREAVVALDMSTSTTHELPHSSMSAVARVVGVHHKVRGVAQARRALALGSSRSASPWESRTRLLAQLDADLTHLGVNVPVFDLDGHLLGVADLIDEFTGLVIESDGIDHREQERHTQDNRREEAFERAGLVVVRVTALDHRDRWDTVARILAAHRDAASSSKRAWTTQQPDWWARWNPGRRWD